MCSSDLAELGISTITYLFDNSVPESKVISPTEGNYFQTVNTISGTSKDLPEGGSLENAGLKEVYIRLRNITDTEWWTGAGWVVDTGTSAFIIASGTDTWNYAFTGSWASNKKYQINVKAYDNVPNEEVAFSTRTFYIDKSSPTCAVTVPASPNVNTPPPSVGGTAVENTPTWDSGVSEVLTGVYDVTVSSYYNGTGWQSAPAWISATSITEPDWSMTIDTNAWTNNHKYQLMCRAIDVAGNWKESGYLYFTFDETEPESFVAVPVHEAYYPDGEPLTLQGTSTDPGGSGVSGVSEVRVQIQRTGDGMYWDGDINEWVLPVSKKWLLCSGAASWTYTVDTSSWPWEDGQKYLVMSRALDNANNVETAFAIGIDSSTFYYDTSLPVSAITYPSGDTNSPPT